MPAAHNEPTRFLGFRLADWSFALRIWASMVVALYVAFWLQLESPSSAAVTVAILAQPLRGQAFTKAFYRVLATAAGTAAAIVIAGLFGGTPTLYLAAFVVWLALTVYVASYFDGGRAYGVVLSGYTVALVAIIQLDAPESVFRAGIERGAAVVVGIAVLAIINYGLGAPDVFPGLMRRMLAVSAETRAFVQSAIRGDEPDPAQVAGLLQKITALRADTETLGGEAAFGNTRAAACRSVIAYLVGVVAAARRFAHAAQRRPAFEADALRAGLLAALDGNGPAQRALCLRNPDPGTSNGEALPALQLRRFALDILEQNLGAGVALGQVERGVAPDGRFMLPLHRDRPAALRNAIRVLISVGAVAICLAWTDWPAASAAVALAGIVAALSSTAPSYAVFARNAAFAMPIAAVTAGIVEFVLLDGAYGFAVLAMALVPPVFIACLLMTNPKTFSFGFLVLVFFPTIIGFANPQHYDAESYATSAILDCTAVLMLFGMLRAVLPTGPAQRVRWILAAMQTEVDRIAAGVRSHGDGDLRYLEAERVVQLAALHLGDEGATRELLRQGLALGDLAQSAARLQASVRQLGADPHLAAPARQARAALARRDAAGLLGVAVALMAAPRREPDSISCVRLSAAVDLFSIAHLLAWEASALPRPALV